MDERRKGHPRQFALTGRIDLEDGWACFCLVHDVSEGGARLTSLDPGSLPEMFKVGLAAGTSRWCQVIWRSKQSVGVKFLASPTYQGDQGLFAS